MRYFIFIFLLTAPLLLTAQSKKDQIATLELRVDSLYKVLVNERINNEQKLSHNREEIFQMSQENGTLEKKMVDCINSNDDALMELANTIIYSEVLNGQLQLAQDGIAKLLTDFQDVNSGEPLFKDYTGLAELYYDEDGERQYSISFKDGKADGVSVKHPECDFGCLEREVPYKDGKVEGLCITNWWVWGQNVDTSYRIETLVKDGKRVSQISYFDNGESEEVVSEIVYKIGKREEGIMRSYLDNEHESYQITSYHNGEIISKKCIKCCDDNYTSYEVPCD